MYQSYLATSQRCTSTLPMDTEPDLIEEICNLNILVNAKLIRLSVDDLGARMGQTWGRLLVRPRAELSELIRYAGLLTDQIRAQQVT